MRFVFVLILWVSSGFAWDVPWLDREGHVPRDLLEASIRAPFEQELQGEFPEADRREAAIAFVEHYYSTQSDHSDRVDLQYFFHQHSGFIPKIESVPFLSRYPFVGEIFEVFQEYEREMGQSSEALSLKAMWKYAKQLRKAAQELIPKNEEEWGRQIREWALIALSWTPIPKLPPLIFFVKPSIARSGMVELRNYMGPKRMGPVDAYFEQANTPVFIGDIHHYVFIDLFTHLDHLRLLQSVAGEPPSERVRNLRMKIANEFFARYTQVVRQLAGLMMAPAGSGSVLTEVMRAMHQFMYGIEGIDDLLAGATMAIARSDLDKERKKEFVAVSEEVLEMLQEEVTITEGARFLSSGAITITAALTNLTATAIHTPFVVGFVADHMQRELFIGRWGEFLIKRGTKLGGKILKEISDIANLTLGIPYHLATFTEKYMLRREVRTEPAVMSAGACQAVLEGVKELGRSLEPARI